MTESLKSTPGGEWLDGLEIGALGPADAEDARGMRDNPVHVAVCGDDAERRQERLRRVFGGGKMNGGGIMASAGELRLRAWSDRYK